MTTVPILAKISRPRVFGVLPRGRLFEKLESLRDRTGIWIAAPGGAGKTSLVVTYLEAHTCPHLWYQLDPDDADPATFFYFLGLAAQSLGSRKRSVLPLFTQEYRDDVPGFSRRYFRELFALMPERSLLVLDNYQEVPVESELHDAIVNALEAVPPGRGVLILSRQRPQKCFSRLLTNQSIAIVDWDDVKLTRDETEEFARASNITSPETVRMLHDRALGWAAGLNLLVEGLRRGHAMTASDVTSDLEEIFEYFAHQVFERISEHHQGILTRLSFLPRMSEKQAIAMTDDPEAANLIERMFRAHLFVDRRPIDPGHAQPLGPTPHSYQFHALFHAFLERRVRDSLALDVRKQMSRRAAELLESDGDSDAAFTSYCQAEAWQDAVRIVLGNAARLVRLGRWRQLVQWILRLPARLLAQEPWLPYWLGAARLHQDPATSRKDSRNGYEAAVERGDKLCAIACAANLAISHQLEWRDLTPMDEWMSVLMGIFDLKVGDPTLELSILSAFLHALQFRDPGNPAYEKVRTRIEALLEADIDENVRLNGATLLVTAAANLGRLDEGQQALRCAEQLILAGRASPYQVCAALHSMAWYCLLIGDFKKCRSTLAVLQRTSEEHGERFNILLAAGAAVGAGLEAVDGDAAACQSWLRILESCGERRELYMGKAMLALQSADTVAAEDFTTKALAIIAQSGLLPNHTYLSINKIWALALGGRFREVLDLATEIEGKVIAFRMFGWLPPLHAARAWVGKQTGQAELLSDGLKRMLSFSRQYGAAMLGRYRRWVGPLCQTSIDLGVETDFVLQVIRQYRWKAPSQLAEPWPWRIRVFSLGRFGIEIDGRPLNFSGKAPKKPLALLKLIASHIDREVAIPEMLDALWPDDEADDAQRSLRSAVFRLRELLGDGDVVKVSEGTVALDTGWVWVDAWAFEQLIEAWEKTNDPRLLSRALRLYKGAFLEQDPDALWALSARERLRTRYTSAVTAAGARHERSKSWDAALEIYTAGILTEDLIEGFHQGRMRSLLALDRRGEALAAYATLKRILSAKLGVAPSRETLALAERAAQDAV